MACVSSSRPLLDVLVVFARMLFDKCTTLADPILTFRALTAAVADLGCVSPSCSEQSLPEPYPS